jgi:hypothetical protein
MFNEEFWSKIVRLVAEALRLSISEMNALQQNRTAKLIGALPALAGARDADRVAVQHVITYLTAQRLEAIFDHRRDDDQPLTARLERISHFPGGDRRVLQRGMDLLTLLMISGYERSQVTDRRKGVYNPLGSGSWDGDREKTRLVKAIRAVPSPEMDQILDLEVALRGEWNG